MNRARFGIICGIALFIAPALARAQSPSPITWKTDTIKSAVLGTSRPYYVALPQGYAQGNRRYPVLVLLDADDQPQFVAALANLQFLTSRDEAPGLIVVGIPNVANQRTHNLTPPTHSATEIKMFPDAGGARAFLDFISDEVLPSVRASYRTLPTTFLAGHSFGGLFALESAATRPDPYTGFVAMSPALQWSNSEYVARYADHILQFTRPVRIFVSSGGLEAPIDINAGRFVARIDSTPHPAVAFRYQRYPENTHGMTPLPSLVDGVRFMFEPISLASTEGAVSALPQNADSGAIVRALSAVAEKYAAGARQLGMPELLPETTLNQYGYTALQYFNQPGAAVAIFKRNVELYPESANVYDSLGDALLAKGDSAGARAQFEKAIELARRTGHPVLQESTRKLEALKKKPVN